MERLTPKMNCCYDAWELCGLDSVCTRDCKGCKIPRIVIKLSQMEDYEEKIKKNTGLSMSQFVSKFARK